MSTFDIRPARPEDMLQLGALTSYVYAGSFGDEADNLISQSIRPEWTTCAFRDDRLVASFSRLPFTMRANGRAVKMGGISAVGTLPEFRRQGLSRALMTEGFKSMRNAGQSVAALWASQAGIYQRYQFTAASIQRSYRIDVPDIRFFDGDFGAAEVARTSLADGFDRMKGIYIDYITDRSGYLHRSRALWQSNMLAEERDDGPLHLAICSDGDTDTGYLLYTVRSGKVDHRARGQEMKVRELVALNSDAYRSLWRFIACHDLVGAVSWSGVPVDDPAPELFQEPRMLHAEDGEGIWFRVVDAEQALAERGYTGNGTLVIRIGPDREAPWNTGTWRLEVTNDNTKVTATDAEPDITVSTKALSSIYCGFRTAGQLAAWQLVSGSEAAVQRTDALFAVRHAPHCPDHF